MRRNASRHHGGKTKDTIWSILGGRWYGVVAVSTPNTKLKKWEQISPKRTERMAQHGITTSFYPFILFIFIFFTCIFFTVRMAPHRYPLLYPVSRSVLCRFGRVLMFWDMSLTRWMEVEFVRKKVIGRERSKEASEA